MSVLRIIKEYIPLKRINYDPNEGYERRFAYKQFQTLYDPSKPTDPQNKKFYGKLYPLFVKGIDEVGEEDGIIPNYWYRCGQGSALGCFDDDGVPIYDENGEIKIVGVDSELGKLAFRPGHHLSSAPVSRHIGVGASKELVYDKNGNPVWTKGGKNSPPKQKTDYGASYSQNVWALVEYSSKSDVTSKQIVPCKTKKGKFKSIGIRDFCENEIYRDTFYHFKTNTNSDNSEDWIIANAIKVVKVLNDEEVKQIAEEHGLKAQYRWKPDGSDRNRFSADMGQFEIGIQD